MKAQCPTKCGRELGTGSFVVCGQCWALVPVAMKNDIARYTLLIRQTRNPLMVQKYIRKQREARTAAVQWVVDKRQKVPA